MTITRYPPNTIYLGGPRTEIGDIAASEAITPGHLVERFNNSGVWRFRKATFTTGAHPKCFATEQSMLNKGVDDAYAAGDLMEVTEGAGGTYIWAIIVSGQNLAFGARLESAGDGTLRALASGTAIAVANETKVAAFTGNTRIRVVVI